MTIHRKNTDPAERKNLSHSRKIFNVLLSSGMFLVPILTSLHQSVDSDSKRGRLLPVEMASAIMKDYLIPVATIHAQRCLALVSDCTDPILNRRLVA
jgi:hypothetical protein